MATPDPTGGGLAQAASELVKDVHNQQAHLDKLAKQQQEVQGSSGAAFEQTMQAQQAGQAPPVAAPAPTDKVGGAAVTDVLRQAKAQSVSPTTKVGATERVEESKLQKMIDGLVNGQDKMTEIMHAALSGRQFSPSELLAMQAGVYRYSQELDLTSKVVQQATSGIKQTLNTQV
jgi:hypothetical protein